MLDGEILNVSNRWTELQCYARKYNLLLFHKASFIFIYLFIIKIVHQVQI